MFCLNYFFLFIYYFLKFISPIINIRLLEIETRSIGHSSEPIEIHLLEKRKGLIKKNFRDFDIYFGQHQIANEFLWTKWKKILKLNFNDKFKIKVFGPVFRIAIKKRNMKMLIPYRHHYFRSRDNDNSWQTNDINNVLKDEKPIIFFSEQEEKIATNFLKKYNILKNDKIILLCNRDPFYRIQLKTNKNEIKYGHRDQKIDDYELGVKYLCDLNYKVIRMGKNMHRKMNFKHDNFFDYAFSEIRSDMLDIYLFKICKFVISSQTGIDSVASLFRKEIFHVNFNEFLLFLNKNCNIVHPKKFFYKKNGKELNIYELYREVVSNHLDYNYNESEIEYKDLNKEEINLAFTEIIKVYENGQDSETIKLNNEVKKKIYEQIGIKYNFLFSKQYLKSFY